MKHLYYGLNVAPMVAAIQRHPELWNEHKERTDSYVSPHGNIDDIWLRYNAYENYKGDREEFNNEHESVWYPSADIIPIKPLVDRVMDLVGDGELGGVLITRIPPGGKCLPHVDAGWHASYYEKFAVQLEGGLDQSFNFDGESFSALAGDLYWFDNSNEHWVDNDSENNRMTLIVCIKRS